MMVDFTLLAVVTFLAQFSSGAVVLNAAQLAPKTTFPNTATVGSQLPAATEYLVKRDAAPRKAVANKEWLKEESERLYGTEEETQRPWIRTIYGSVKEVVTPYVVGGVTFAAQPPATADGLEPWISIKNDGLPKTITPKMKNNVIENSFPAVRTFFQTATTVVHHQNEIQAHNLADGETVEEVIMIDEDDTYAKLSPIQRCTPDYYYKKGIANMDSSEPFCSPRDHQKMRAGATYFITWYSRFFKKAKNVRFHYAFVNEKSHEKGFDKRDLMDSAVKKVEAEIEELSGNVDFSGDVHGAFFSSDWVHNDNGWFAVEVDKKWLRGKVYKKVVIAMQPDNVADEDFSILNAPHIFATFQLRESIGKNTKEMRKIQDKAGTGDDVYYVIASIPTVVMISVLFMYGFLYINRRHRDLSKVKKPKRSRFGNQGKYNIPVALTDIRKPNKQL